MFAWIGRLLGKKRETPPSPTSLFDLFTVRARTTMKYSREHAIKAGMEWIDTNHVLLGLLEESDDVCAAMLRELNVNITRLREETLRRTPKGTAAEIGNMPFTPRAKRVLERALYEARSLNHNYVGTEHLLMGLVLEPDGLAGQVLTDAGVKEAKARRAMLKILSSS